MFDESGRPPGYGQHSPFQDSPQAPGQVPQEKVGAPGAGSAAPTVPTDPTLAGWRQPQMPRMLGAPHVPPAGAQPQGGLQGAILGQSQQAPMPQAQGGLGPYAHDFSPRNPDGSLNTNVQLGQVGQPPAPAATGPWGAAGDPQAWLHQRLNAIHSTDNQSYWDGEAAKDPKFMSGDPSAMNWWGDAIDRGDGSELVKNGTLQKRNAGKPPINPLQAAISGQAGAPADQTGNNNPLLNAIRQQLMQRQVSQPHGL